MRFGRVHHVSLNVTDLAAATTFYTEVLELPVLPRPDFDFGGLWLDAGEQQIHLIEVDEFEAPRGQHFALQVDDLATTVTELTRRGVDVSPPRTIDDVCAQAFLTDPTGNLIELNQPF
jgi:catechol 2,3-dioxygenase-like lactoylglutathione lyase family enzyme